MPNIRKLPLRKHLHDRIIRHIKKRHPEYKQGTAHLYLGAPVLTVVKRALREAKREGFRERDFCLFWTINLAGDCPPYAIVIKDRQRWDWITKEERESPRFQVVKRVINTLVQAFRVRRVRYARTRAEPLERCVLGALGWSRTVGNSRLVAQAMADRRFPRVNIEGRHWYLGCKVVLPPLENDQ
jgi:hypothetical protein